MSETFKSIRQRVHAARNIQYTWFAKPDDKSTKIVCNADMHIGDIRKFSHLQDVSQSLICSGLS